MTLVTMSLPDTPVSMCLRSTIEVTSVQQQSSHESHKIKIQKECMHIVNDGHTNQ